MTFCMMREKCACSLKRLEWAKRLRNQRARCSRGIFRKNSSASIKGRKNSLYFLSAPADLADATIEQMRGMLDSDSYPVAVRPPSLVSTSVVVCCIVSINYVIFRSTPCIQSMFQNSPSKFGGWPVQATGKTCIDTEGAVSRINRKNTCKFHRSL